MGGSAVPAAAPAPPVLPPSPPTMETPRPDCHGPPPAPRPRAGDSPMALAGGGGGGIAAAADAGLRLAALPACLPPSLLQPRRHRAGRPLPPPPPRAASRQPTRRPPRRFTNAPYADSAEGPRPFRTAPTRARSGGRTDLAARLGCAARVRSSSFSLAASAPTPHTLASSPASPSTQRRLPARRGTRRGPRVCTSRPSQLEDRTVISSRSVSGGKKTARRPF